GRVAEHREPVPAAELDRAELWMLERVPVDVALAAELAVAPAQELEVVLGGMLAIPVGVVIALDPRLPDRRPDLDRPDALAEVLVDTVEAAGDDIIGVVFEVVEDRDVGVSRELGRFLPE